VARCRRRSPEDLTKRGNWSGQHAHASGNDLSASPACRRLGRTLMTRLKLNAAKIAALVGLLLAGVGVSAALAAPDAPNAGGPPSTVPGSPGDDCSHGKSGTDCRPDPNENGKDCDDHGNARGNEDHCDQAVTTTTPPTSTDTTTIADTTTTTTTPQTTTTPTTTQTGTTPATTTATPPVTAAAPPATASATAPPATSSSPVTKPELQKELAKQVKEAQAGRVSHATSNPRELPFTGFPAWALAIIGSLVLATGLGLRRLAS
jgi:hypothetical protein